MKDGPKSARKPGLWHGPLRIEVEAAKRAHRKACSYCDHAPVARRLKVVAGSGRSAVTHIYCEPCGEAFLADHAEECARARHYLRTGEGVIRASS